MFKIGDSVSVLDEAINGVVVAVKNNQVSIETTDGFLMTYNVNELIKIQNSSNLLKSIRSVNANDIHAKSVPKKHQNFVKERKDKREIPAPEFDLHIEKLVQNHRGMSNYEVLNLQAETAKRHLEFAIKNRIPKIIFIHGVGEGILKAELVFLFGRYENIDFQDANYQKYGQGATEVYIRQKAIATSR